MIDDYLLARSGPIDAAIAETIDADLVTRLTTLTEEQA